MPYAEPNSSYVDYIDGLKKINPETGNDGMCTTDHVDGFFF